MTAAARPYALPLNPDTRRSPGWWVMMLVIVTEAMLFAYFLFGYLYLWSLAEGRWPPDGPPRLTLVAPNTAILIVSSISMWWGERGIRQGSPTRLCIGLFITLILGVIFLSLQGVEYSREQFTPRTNAYGSLFFTITGFHAAHVAVGLLMNVVVQVRAWLGHFDAKRHLAVTNAAMYWHFVDGVWIVVFFTLYIAPRLA